MAALCAVLCGVAVPSWAGEEETLDLFTAFQQESSAASRVPKPLSQTAENVIVITRDQIEALNAHTLADILDTVPGLTVENRGGPGNTSYLIIQGVSFVHTLVTLDGAPLNDSAQADISAIPAQIIERIEIVKGGASSAWGQALGGVVAVTTKSPTSRPIGGSAYTSVGERGSTDSRLELSGTAGNLGYYLSGGYLGSDGVRPQPNSQVNSTTEFAKLTYDLPDRGKLWTTLLYNHANLGVLYAPAYDFLENINTKQLNATLGFSRPLTERLSLELLGRYRFNHIGRPDYLISDGSLGEDGSTWNHSGGASGKLTWRGEGNLLVLGGEYEHYSYSFRDVAWWWGDPPSVTLSERQQDRFGIFLNDTIELGPVTLSPGVRYDRINGSSQFSPALGATWQLTEQTLLRVYTAKGHALPSFNYQGMEKLWTSQIGLETTAIPYLWLKGTLLRNETWDIQPSSTRTISLGTELELKTKPVFDTTLGVGWLYLNTTEAGGSKGTTLYVPTNTVHLSLGYDDHRLFRGTLIGRHIFWPTLPEDNASCSGMVWDLFLGATVVKRPDLSLELFFSGHNLFDTKQYWFDQVPNTGRWFEGGMKVRF